jgi:hypothetical protein
MKERFSEETLLKKKDINVIALEVDKLIDKVDIMENPFIPKSFCADEECYASLSIIEDQNDKKGIKFCELHNPLFCNGCNSYIKGEYTIFKGSSYHH